MDPNLARTRQIVMRGVTADRDERSDIDESSDRLDLVTDEQIDMSCTPKIKSPA